MHFFEKIKIKIKHAFLHRALYNYIKNRHDLISKVITWKLENASFLATSATLILPVCEPVLCTLGQDPV